MEQYESDTLESGSPQAAAGETLPHIIFKLKDHKYAISSEFVIHMEALGPVTPMVDMDPHCRGMILFNGVSVPIYNLRSMFGIEDLGQELKIMMQQRIRDHEAWVQELESSVLDERDFTLTTDPRACAFGKWYDAFESDNSYLNIFLKNIEEPHRKIHETGDTVKRLMSLGKQEEARAAIQEMKEKYFSKTIELLGQVSDAYLEGSKEMLIYYQVDGVLKGIVVDSISDIHVLDDLYGLPEIMRTGESQYIERVAKDAGGTTGRDSVIQVINARAI